MYLLVCGDIAGVPGQRQGGQEGGGALGGAEAGFEEADIYQLLWKCFKILTPTRLFEWLQDEIGVLCNASLHL